MAGDTLSVTDNRTGKKYEIPIQDETIRAIELRQIRVADEDFGLMTYDPGFTNTASCRSQVTFIDGEKGILRYRGYPIEQLAGNYRHLEIAYLLLSGELPTQAENQVWTGEISSRYLVPEDIRRLLEAFHHDASPMAMVASAVASLSAFYPEARDLDDPRNRRLQTCRLIAQIPTIAAFAYRRTRGLPLVYPRRELSYSANFLNMAFRTTESEYEIDPVLEKAVDTLFILHADHEQNCSANAMRSVGSSRSDPYVAAAAAIGALSGPLHGGANEAVLRMLSEIRSEKNIESHIKRVKRGEIRLMGFGHRVYKNYDPRAKIIKGLADQVLEITGSNPLLDVARKLERIALEDDYFVGRKLYPNVDFYSGLIYQALGFHSSMFPVLFAIGRTSGWLAQWEEMMQDQEQKIARPRQIYQGPGLRDVPTQRSAAS